MSIEAFILRLRVGPWALAETYSSSLLTLLGVGASVVIVLSTLVARSGAMQADQAINKMTRMVASSAPTQSLPSTDFAAKLPAAAPSAVAWQRLQRACANAGVSLIAVKIREHASTPERLARLEAVASLQGTYPSTQRALKEIADRDADRFTLTRLRILRGAQVGEVLTEVTYTLWGAPTPDGMRR